MKVNFKLVAFILILTFSCMLVFSTLAKARRPWVGFYFILPETIEASPGDVVEIDAGVINIGWYWLHNFNITVSGLPEDYEVKVEPNYFAHLRILRAWNPEKGVYRVPEKFKIIIKVPEDSAGVFLVEVKGKEYRSWRKFTNSSTFILRVSAPPKLSLSDISIPEKVEEFKKFNGSFEVKNEGLTDMNVSMKIIVPQDWKVNPEELSLLLKPKSSKKVEFNVTPTNTSGEILVLASYNYKGKSFNLTKETPTIVPVVVPKEIVVEAPTGFSTFIDFLAENPIIAIIAAILLIIIIWNSWEIAKYYIGRGKRTQVEKIVEPQVQ